MWLTGFTGVLAAVGIGQGILIYRQVRLGRDEFNATHRPKLRVRNINIEATGSGPFKGNFVFITPGESMLGEFFVSNIGDAPAHIEGAFIMMLGTERPLPMGRPYDGRAANCVFGPRTLEPGHVAQVNIDCAAESQVFVLSYGPTQFHPKDTPFYALGWVTYRDDRGIRRKTTFARKWSDDVRRFLRMEGDMLDYENEE